MKVTREQALLNRQRVVETAGRLFREHGFDGVGIADVMKAAGLTHGGFYAQFPSKEHLMAEAATCASEETDNQWRETLERTRQESLSGFAEFYLSADHRDHPAIGCVVSTLGVDVARQGALVRTAFTNSVKRIFGLLESLVPDRVQKARRSKAIASFAAMVGGVVLARGVNDEALSDEILKAVSEHIAGLEAAGRKR